MAKQKMTTKPDDATIRGAFQQVADYCGGDILQCCIDCGEEPIIPRDALIDYLGMHGGPDGKAVFDWVLSIPGSMKNVERELDKARVPRSWD